MNMSLPQPIISLNGEDISYSGSVALRDISLSIAEGEKVALIGRSGVGKTTLLRRLYQLRPKESAFVHQHYSLVSQLSVFHNIYMGRLDRYSSLHNLRNLLRPMPSHIEEIRPIAEKLSLQDKLFSKTGELSGGQQQRVGIGRALYCGGSILMADEPVSSLDLLQGKEIMALIVGAGKTVISTLHSVDLSRQFFDRIIGLREKTIFFDLPAHQISGDLLAELYG